MAGTQSVTVWLGLLRDGQLDEAARKLWEAYFSRLVRLAQARLGGTARRAPDAEDVALSAFASFVRAAAAGRFPRLEDRDDLWQVLLVLTARKAGKLVRHENAVRRGGGREGALPDLVVEGNRASALELVSDEPDPAEAAVMAEECERLLERLGEPRLRQVAVWKLEGYSNSEIAGLLDRSEGTVERKLQLIRQIWQDATGP